MNNSLRALLRTILPLDRRRKIQKIFAIGQFSLPKSRDEYKATWTKLSNTAQKATLHVIADVGEDEIQAAGLQTRIALETSVGISPSDVILEIGCGIGRVGQVLAPMCKQWIGCDVSPNMLKHSRRRLAPFSNVEFIEVSGFDLQPVTNESVDLVYCTVVFMHLDEWDRYNYILEAHRVLRPGGRIFVDNFNLCSNEGWEFFETTRKEFPPRYRPPHISKSSTPQEIEAYLKRARFQEVAIREQGTWIQGWGTKSA